MRSRPLRTRVVCMWCLHSFDCDQQISYAKHTAHTKILTCAPSTGDATRTPKKITRKCVRPLTGTRTHIIHSNKAGKVRAHGWLVAGRHIVLFGARSYVKHPQTCGHTWPTSVSRPAPAEPDRPCPFRRQPRRQSPPSPPTFAVATDS